MFTIIKRTATIIMPSTVVVEIPKGKEPSIAAALLMVAAQEEEKEKLLESYGSVKMSASSSAADVAAIASASSSSPSLKRTLEGTGDAISDSFEPLPKKNKEDTSHASFPVTGGEKKEKNYSARAKQKRSSDICSAEGCKNEPMIEGLCLVHGAKMSLLPSSGNFVGKKISPVNDVDNESRGAASSWDDAASLSSDNNCREGEDWPLTNITTPGKNDCLYGRGGKTNHHPGNQKYRKLVDSKKAVYLASTRLDKPEVSLSVVHFWRAMNPPGRFLEQDKTTRLWHDVGDDRAREKTSQALREKPTAPYVKKKDKQAYGALSLSPFNEV